MSMGTCSTAPAGGPTQPPTQEGAPGMRQPAAGTPQGNPGLVPAWKGRAACWGCLCVPEGAPVSEKRGGAVSGGGSACLCRGLRPNVGVNCVDFGAQGQRGTLEAPQCLCLQSGAVSVTVGGKPFLSYAPELHPEASLLARSYLVVCSLLGVARGPWYLAAKRP